METKKLTNGVNTGLNKLSGVESGLDEETRQATSNVINSVNKITSLTPAQIEIREMLGTTNSEIMEILGYDSVNKITSLTPAQIEIREMLGTTNSEIMGILGYNEENISLTPAQIEIRKMLGTTNSEIMEILGYDEESHMKTEQKLAKKLGLGEQEMQELKKSFRQRQPISLTESFSDNDEENTLLAA